MPGFGEGPFGSFPFGEWPWSLFTLVQGVPGVYQEQDDLAGAGALRALLEGLVPSLDGLRQKIRDYDDLRDPLKVPIDTDFTVSVIVIRTDNQGDGTSIVFLSEGPDGDKYKGVRPGMTLTDLSGSRFTISSVASSALPADVTNPPIDPATGLPTGRHIVVENIGLASTELIPFTSSVLVTNENPAPIGAVGSIVAIAKALFVDGETFTLNDGVHPPVTFEFDVTPDGVTPGNVAINISALTTAIDVADAMVAAINGVVPLNLTATNGGGTLATVTITNFGAGTAGNGALWSETVANIGFVLTQPSGGAPGAFPLDPLGIDDGVAFEPYRFNLQGSYIGGLDLARNRVVLIWTEGGVSKSGFFTSTGLPGGDLADTATINFSSSAPSLAAGQIKLYNDSGAAIDVRSIRVTYTYVETIQVADATINAQNILAFLSNDYGIKLDRNDPEFLQRSYVNNAWKIWDRKGTALGYSVLGQYAGYFVSALALYAISSTVAASLPSAFVFAFPEGTPSIGSITAIPQINIIDGETFTLDDGVNAPTTFEFDTVPDGVTPGNVAIDISGATTAIDVASAMVAAINGVGGSLNLNASNDAGASSIVTIENGSNGEFGNVLTWADTVADVNFVIVQPVGGTDGDLFTTINPGRGLFDEIALDAIPLDELCSDVDYPQIIQVVNATSVVLVEVEGSNKRNLVTVVTATMYESFATDGSFTDFNSVVFDIHNFTRVNATTYTFEVVSFVNPVVGAGIVTWQVLGFDQPYQSYGTLTLVSIPLNGETITIGAKTYTFQTVLTNVDGNVWIGSSTTSAINNLFAAITLGPGAGTAYAVAMSAHPTAFAIAPVALTMLVYALVGGVGGDSIVTTETLAGGSFSAATLIGGSPSSCSIIGIGTDVVDLGVQYHGYTGHRYRITKPFPEPPIIAGIGNWAFIDSAGVISYIESFQLVSGAVYQFEIISATVPSTGPANIFYNCEIVTECDFCRASSILVRISPSAILAFPSALAGDALDRLIIRLTQMIPAHVRIAAFVLDQGPAIATWAMSASATAKQINQVEADFDVTYDDEDYPADFIPADASPITATSTVTITNQNVFEEYIIGPSNPIISGVWTATGLWHVTMYRS